MKFIHDFENLLENSGFSAFELQHILMKFELKHNLSDRTKMSI